MLKPVLLRRSERFYSAQKQQRAKDERDGKVSGKEEVAKVGRVLAPLENEKLKSQCARAEATRCERNSFMLLAEKKLSYFNLSYSERLCTPAIGE